MTYTAFQLYSAIAISGVIGFLIFPGLFFLVFCAFDVFKDIRELKRIKTIARAKQESRGDTQTEKT